MKQNELFAIRPCKSRLEILNNLKKKKNKFYFNVSYKEIRCILMV